MYKLSRRQFLALGAAFATQLVTPPLVAAYDDSEDKYSTPERPFGRVIGWNQGLFRAPTHASKLEGFINRDSAIPLHYKVIGTEGDVPNRYWYRTDGGFVHSAWIQPVENTPNPEIITDIPEGGLWAEVCMPTIRGRVAPDEDSSLTRTMYYETTYHVTGAEKDSQGQWWYAIGEGYTWGGHGTYVPAWALRILQPEALTPISPDVKDKRIVIRIEQQDLTCYEGDRIVKQTGIGSGLWATPTPRGEFTVQYKRPTRRMQGDDYDLLGVPFPVYINWNGVAIHGTYWHNDFVQRHSHGCVNIPSSVAKWIYRWVTPVAAYDEVTHFAENGEGTPVTVL